MNKLLHIKDFILSVKAGEGYRRLLDKLNMTIGAGEIVGLVGPSGSGKTLTINSILQLVLYQNKEFEQEGDIIFDGESLIDNPEIYKIRNLDIGIVFQQSNQIFNPAQKIGKQIKEKLLLFQKLADPNNLVLDALKQVQLKDPHKTFSSYPHELSGGQLQRCLIAMAIINKPKLLIADEPFSSLDDEVQEELIKLFNDLNAQLNLSILLVSHNKTLVSRLSHRIYSIKQGLLTEGLIDSQSKPLRQNVERLKRRPLVEIVNLDKQYNQGFLSSKSHQVLQGVNLTIDKGEIVGLHGASGIGKSTLARLLVRLEHPSGGQINYEGLDISSLSAGALKEYKSKCQIIFQDSLSSMPPHRTILQQLSDVYYVLNKPVDKKAISLHFEALGLNRELLTRYRHELSGGQRQRIMIVRALLMGVEFLICDEILASLDEEVGYALLHQLRELNSKSSLTILFISHNKQVLQEFCSKVLSFESLIQASINE